MDAARVAKRLGATEVHILYRRSIEDMPADKREIHEAMEEGFSTRTGSAHFVLRGRSRVEKIVCKRMKLEGFDREEQKARRDSQ